MSDLCGEIALDIRTYYAGKNQLTHPNIITFEKAWHGYKYYMAYTAYPYANGSEENPCIAVSNNLYSWKKPDNMINPIACCEELECDELKDTHLLYREDLDQLELWYLGRIKSSIQEGGPLCCFRKVSKDGINWSNYEVMYKNFSFVSPSIIYQDKKYILWGIKNDIGLYYMTSTNGFDWSSEIKCNICNIDKTNVWHGTVSKINNNFYFVWVGNKNMNKNFIYCSTSSDGINFSSPKVIIKNKSKWKFLYRPCLINVNKIYFCFYGVIRHDGKWLISMSSGCSLETLNGIKQSDLIEISQDYEDICSSTFKMKVKYSIKNILNLFSMKFFIILPLLLILSKVIVLNIFILWLFSIFICINFSYYISYNNFKYSIRQGILMGTVLACVACFIYDIFNLMI